jgi:hypothetical protein
VHPQVIAVMLAVAGTPEDPALEREPLEPVAATGQTLPDPGDLHELSLRRIQEHELAKRPHQRSDLQQHRDQWAKKHVENYRYTVSGRGGWGIDTGAVMVTVRNGTAISAEYVRLPLHIARASPDAAKVPAEISISPPHDGVPGLFEIVETALGSSSTLITVHYDVQYGFPVSIATDQVGVSDVASSTYIGDFEVLE